MRGRAKVLRVCYRTSHQIRSTADHLLEPEIVDLDGNEESRRGPVSVFDGPEPLVRLFADEVAETAGVSDWLRARREEGMTEDELAVLVRGQQQLGRARAAVKAAGLDIPAITMHVAKGLEFRAVAVMALDDDVLPDPERLAGVGDVADIVAIQDTERHLLYVAAPTSLHPADVPSELRQCGGRFLFLASLVQGGCCVAPRPWSRASVLS